MPANPPGPAGPSQPADLSEEDYRRLLQLRTALRGFIHWSEDQARADGLTAAQHQLLLAIRGHPDPAGPTIGQAAAYLYMRHHSAVGLADRAETAGLVRRVPDPHDGRVVHLRLTATGRRRLRVLSARHLEELGRLASHLGPLLRGLGLPRVPDGGTG